ncbi:hypothetical protein STEG23_009029, partial [Scotinomys teguina]
MFQRTKWKSLVCVLYNERDAEQNHNIPPSVYCDACCQKDSTLQGHEENGHPYESRARKLLANQVHFHNMASIQTVVNEDFHFSGIENLEMVKFQFCNFQSSNTLCLCHGHDPVGGQAERRILGRIRLEAEVASRTQRKLDMTAKLAKAPHFQKVRDVPLVSSVYMSTNTEHKASMDSILLSSSGAFSSSKLGIYMSINVLMDKKTLWYIYTMEYYPFVKKLNHEIH